MAYTDADREPLLPADEKAAAAPPPPYEELPTPAPAPAPRHTHAKRALLVVALVAAAVVFWHLPFPTTSERRAHACGSDHWLDTLRAHVRWEDVACRVRGQAHTAACRTSFDERRREAERTFLAEPKAERARRALQLYTEMHHLAGEKADYVSALHQIQEWSALLGLPEVEDAAALVHDAGSGESQALWKERRPRTEHTPQPRVWADTYAVWLDQPVSASLSLADAETNATVWTADLAEEVLEEDPTSARGMPPFHGYSHSGAASGPLVYVGDGHKDDFARLAAHGVDFRGKVVLVRYGGLFRGLKVRAAQEAGAVGVLIYSDLTEDDEVTEANGYAAYPDGPARQPSSVQRGSVQALSFYPGDPATPGAPSYRNATRLRVDEADTLPKIPSLPISYRTALRLLASLDGHGFEVAEAGDHLPGALPGVRYWSGPSAEVVHMHNEMDLQTRDIWNVYAVIPGYIDDERIVLGNHRDAWTFGGVDPSSGTAVVHEVLAGLGALVRSGWKPMRTIVVASWDAEEYGLVGSTEFGEDYAEHIQENVAMYLNLDMAVGGSQLSAAASPSLAALLRGAAADVADPTSARGAPLSFAGLVYLVSGGDLSSLLQNGVHAGDALMLLAAIVYALYGVLLKRWNLPITGWQSTYMQALCALAVMFPAFLATPAPLRQVNAATLPLIIYAGALASVVLPFLWIRGVAQLGPNRCAIFMNLLPVLTAAAAIVMLGEPVKPFHVIGGGLALLGVACAQAFPRPLRAARQGLGPLGHS